MVVYDDVLQFGSLINTNMCIRLVDHSTRQVEGIIDDIFILVRNSYVTADFMVLNTSRNPKVPIILGRPFLCTAKAIIYAETSDMRFNINENKEMFSFNPRKPNKPRRQSP